MILFVYAYVTLYVMILARPRISVVIPAYNEELYIAACLDALAAQTAMPYEVIVVDNNSNDRTAAIAASYPFVRVVREPRQGKAYAREAGFRAATGDVFARIDADTRVRPNWTQALAASLDANPQAAAVTGKCLFYDVPVSRIASAVHAVLYHYFQRLLAGTEVLWGSNMAVRSEAWEAVRSECSMREDIDEDIDFTFLLHKHRLVVVRDCRIVADVSALRGKTTPRAIRAYLQTWPKDYELHGMPHRAAVIRAVTAGCQVATYIPALVLSRRSR